VNRQPPERERRTKLRLSRPISIRGEEVEELTLWPMTLAHLREFPISGANVGHVVAIGAKMAGLEVHDLEPMIPEDVSRLIAIVSRQLQRFTAPPEKR